MYIHFVGLPKERLSKNLIQNREFNVKYRNHLFSNVLAACHGLTLNIKKTDRLQL
jgi:hypothetical protein